MQQQHFPVLNIASEDQRQLVEDLGIIVNELGYRVIEIERRKKRFKGGQGVLWIQYKKKVHQPDMLGEDNEAEDQALYEGTIIGAKMNFVRNPYGKPVDVAYLLDDEEDISDFSRSGSTTGWNREFLASHYGDGHFHIVDEEIRADVERRFEAIKQYNKDHEAEQKAREAAVQRESDDIIAKMRGVNKVEVVMPAGAVPQQGAPIAATPAPAVAPDVAKLIEGLQKQNAELAAQVAASKKKSPSKKKPAKKKAGVKKTAPKPTAPPPKESETVEEFAS